MIMMHPINLVGWLFITSACNTVCFFSACDSYTKEDSASAAITRENVWKPQMMPSFKWMAFQNGTSVDMMTATCATDLNFGQITIHGQCC